MKFLDGLKFLNRFNLQAQDWIMENIVNPASGKTLNQELKIAPYVGNFPCAFNPSYKQAVLAGLREHCRKQKMPYSACLLNKKILQ